MNPKLQSPRNPRGSRLFLSCISWLSLCLFVSLSLSLSLESIYLCIDRSSYLSIYLSIVRPSQAGGKTIYLCIYLSIYLYTHTCMSPQTPEALRPARHEGRAWPTQSSSASLKVALALWGSEQNMGASGHVMWVYRIPEALSHGSSCLGYVLRPLAA